ncbi:MAG: TIM barrel protein, partial [Bacteroidota bacterium]
MRTRREFLANATLGAAAITLNPLNLNASDSGLLSTMKNPKISLAQWSLHRALQKGTIKAENFAAVSRNDFGIGAVEYVNQFYVSQVNNQKFWGQMKQAAEDHSVESLLIMVDAEGDLGNPKEKARKKSVENHFKWIQAAKLLGCHSIRVNAFGKGEREELKSALVDGLGQLAAYGAKLDIRVLIENHGLHTSDGKYMVGIIEEVNNPYLGTLPDFGNWCMNAEWGSTKDNNCTEVYDPYQGVADFLPFAKGVSAKTYAFDE